MRKIGNMGAKFQPADSFDEFNFKKNGGLKNNDTDSINVKLVIRHG